jgi:hypothetical protein
MLQGPVQKNIKGRGLQRFRDNIRSPIKGRGEHELGEEVELLLHEESGGALG